MYIYIYIPTVITNVYYIIAASACRIQAHRGLLSFALYFIPNYSYNIVFQREECRKFRMTKKSIITRAIKVVFLIVVIARVCIYTRVWV